jgi:hypothetical protein
LLLKVALGSDARATAGKPVKVRILLETDGETPGTHVVHLSVSG